MLGRLTSTTVGLVLIVRTVRTAVAHRCLRYAAAVVAGEAVVGASLIRIAVLVDIRCKTKQRRMAYSGVTISVASR